nr:PREDICTED: cysteine dioxygenase type 1 [Bemisia tabaci]
MISPSEESRTFGTNPLRAAVDAEPETRQTPEINNNDKKIGHSCFMEKYYRSKEEGTQCEECQHHNAPQDAALLRPVGKFIEEDYAQLFRDRLIIDEQNEPRLKYGINTLYDLMSELRRAFETEHVNIQYVSAIMAAYKSNPREWERFAKFDKYRYTRNLVDVGNGKYNLMLLCWGEGHGSAIHDHANAHCFMKMLHGELCETRFEWPEKEIDPDNISEGEEAALKEKGRTILRQNQVCYINDSLGLHRVENVSNSERAVSLHLYCPPFDSCSVFNQRTGHRSTSKVTFWSIYGERRNKKLMEDVEPEDN